MKYVIAVMVVVLASTISGVNVVQAQDVTAEGRALERQARIESYKESVADRLSESEQLRIAGICGASQVKIELLSATVDTIVEKRQSTYGTVSDKLALLSDQISATEIDTQQLDSYISELQNKAQLTMTLLTEYRTTLGDIATMNCETDVDGFQAGLTVARESRNNIKVNADELSEYVQTTIKPELLVLREKLVQAQPTIESEL